MRFNPDGFATGYQSTTHKEHPMSYIESVIMPNEHIIAYAKTHWFIYTSPTCWLLLSIVLMFPIPLLGVTVMIISLLIFLKAWLYTYSTELAVTSRRIITKFGFIRRNTVELRHDKVESIHVNQGIIGRIFNFGSIIVTGSGGTNAPIPYIADPLKFRSAALAGVEPAAG
jgi:uncharacterized membrane protein YdbT with pleckstrin-like domain